MTLGSPDDLAHLQHFRTLVAEATKEVANVRRLDTQLAGEIIWSEHGNEIIWSEHGNEVVLTPDDWLVYLSVGQRSIYGRRLRATPDLVAMLRSQG